jgi:hypothetical protein
MANPNPSVTVQSGAGSVQTTPPVAIATSAAAVTVRLVSQAGVDSWTLTCVSSDETSNKSDLAPVVNVTTGVATFTLPAGLGKAWILQSTVKNNASPTAYSGTFKIAVLTAGGLAVAALGETLETDALYGNLALINAGIRAAGTGGGDASAGILATTAAAFSIPSGGLTVSVTFASTAKLSANLPIVIPVAGSYQVASITNATTAVLKNLGGPSNATSGIVASGTVVVSGGLTATAYEGASSLATTGTVTGGALASTTSVTAGTYVSATSAVFAGTSVQAVSFLSANASGAYLALGVAPAGTGTIRIPNGGTLYGKTLGGADLAVLNLTTGNNLIVGDVNLNAATLVYSSGQTTMSTASYSATVYNASGTFVFTGGAMSIGANPATAGMIRTPNGTTWNLWNGSSNTNILNATYGGNFQFGVIGGYGAMYFDTSTSLNFRTSNQVAVFNDNGTAQISHSSVAIGPTNANVNIYNPTPGGDQAPYAIGITSQAPYASATTNKGSGDIWMSLATPLSGGAYGALRVRMGTTDVAAFSQYLVTFAAAHAETVKTKAVTGGAVALTSAEAAGNILEFTGTLASNCTVTLPAGLAGVQYAVNNKTSGAFTLTLVGSGGAGTAFTVGTGKLATMLLDASSIIRRTGADITP